MIESANFDGVALTLMLLVLVAVCTALAFRRKPNACWQLSSHVPSATKTFWNKMHVTWKMSTQPSRDILPFFADLIKENGAVVHFNLAGRAYVLLNDPDDIKIVLSSKDNITKGPEYMMMKPWLNDGLLLSTGLKWQNRRKLLTNTFHYKMLDIYNPSINKHSRVLVKKLLEATAKNEEISIMDYMSLCTLDIICESIMGAEMNAQKGGSSEYVKCTKNACKSLIKRIFTVWLWNEWIFRISECGKTFYKSTNVLHEFNDNVIQKKRVLQNESKKRDLNPDNENRITQRKSFLDIILSLLDDNPDGMTNGDIREEVDTFLFEGHDTSSVAIGITLLLLGMHQDVQDTARNEVLSIFGDSDREVTMEDLTAMKYLDAVVKESLRLYPSIPGITRELQSPLDIKNYSLPPKTIIIISPYILHRSKDIFPNPEEFVPERFLDEDNKSKFLFGYLPFSAGLRNCIGQKFAMNEIKIIVSTVLRKSKIKTLGNKEDIKISADIVLGIESIPKMEFHEI